MQQGIATAAGVDKSIVTIRITAASVRITATIAVPADTTAVVVHESLSSTLGNATSASAVLGINAESDPSIYIVQDSTDEVAVTAAIAGGSVGGVLVCIMVVLVGVAGRAWCKKRPTAKARISMRSQAKAGTSADHDDFLNISSDVTNVNKTGFDELSEDNFARVLSVGPSPLVVPIPPAPPAAAKASLPTKLKISEPVVELVGVAPRSSSTKRTWLGEQQPDVRKGAGPQDIGEALVACGLEHRVKAFEDDGYTLDNARTALSAGQAVLRKDLRERMKLPLGECRRLISHLEVTNTSVAGSSEEAPGDKDTTRALTVPTRPAQQAAEVPVPEHAVLIKVAATHSATLTKTPLGLGVTLNPDNIVTYVKDGSQAEREGRIQVGDLVVSLNGAEPPPGKGVTAIIQSLPMGTKLEFLLQSAAARKPAPEVADAGQSAAMRKKSSAMPTAMRKKSSAMPAGWPPEETVACIRTSDQSQPENGSGPQGIAAALVACGLEHRVKAFEDDGYTLDNARTALSAGQAVLLTDLRQRMKLPLGESRRLISHIEATGNTITS